MAQTLEESAVQTVLSDPAVMGKMIDYVRINGYTPHNDPFALCAQVAMIRESLRERFKEKIKPQFKSEKEFDNYCMSPEFDLDAEYGVDEMEAQMGFYGFDDDDTHHIIPLAIGAITALAKNKKVQQVVGKGIKAVGSLMKKKNKKGKETPVSQVVAEKGNQLKAIVKHKQKQKGAITAANEQMSDLNARVAALSAGVPVAAASNLSAAQLAPITSAYADTASSNLPTKNQTTEASPDAPGWLPAGVSPVMAGVGLFVLLVILYFAIKK